MPPIPPDSAPFVALPSQVAILLSVWNGAPFLPAQLASLLAQTHTEWRLFWRDDGSDDASAALLAEFAAGAGRGRCVAVAPPPGAMAAHMGVTGSFLHLLAHAVQAAPEALIAFADQDDVWLPEKLARGVAALGGADRAALYCARQQLVDAALRPLGLSLPVRRRPEFPAALTQNIATGCTVMLNQAAGRLVGASAAPSVTLHDWWCYLVVSASGGQVLVDDTPTVLYRQHRGNAVGAPAMWWRRALAALRRGPRLFMTVLRGHVAALQAQPELLSPGARRQVAEINHALRGGMLARLACLRLRHLRRQTWQESLLFAWWFLRG